MAVWHTVDSARDQWTDAPVDEDDGDTILTELLDVAKAAVLAFAPAINTSGVEVDEDGYIVNIDPDTIPATYRKAQLMQARNIWNSDKAGPRGEFDGADYALSSFPLDWQVRQLLRPKRGKPVIV